MNDEPILTARIDTDAGPAPSADQARVPWWSFTKTALATAALRLVADGRIVLDTPIGDRPYSLRHLLQHRSGLPEYGALAAYHDAVRRGDTPWSEAELLDRVGADRLLFPPGKGWTYSNVGYRAVRRLIEQATDRDIGDALRQLVFDRLGLASVRIATTAADLAATAWGNRAGYDPRWVYHGLLCGTPGDAVRFLRRLLTGDLLPAPLLAEMTAGVRIAGALPGRPWQTAGYGLGLMIGDMGVPGIGRGHTGGGPGSVAAVYHFDERRSPCTVAAFSTGEDGGAIEFAAVRLASDAAPSP